MPCKGGGCGEGYRHTEKAKLLNEKKASQHLPTKHKAPSVHANRCRQHFAAGVATHELLRADNWTHRYCHTHTIEPIGCGLSRACTSTNTNRNQTLFGGKLKPSTSRPTPTCRRCLLHETPISFMEIPTGMKNPPPRPLGPAPSLS